MSDKIKKLVVIAHAPSPNTVKLKDAVLAGARHSDISNVETRWVAPLEAQPDHVLNSDGVILGTTENLGYMSGALKDFFDRCFYPLSEKTDALPFAFYIRAGLDGTGTRRAIESITSGMKWRLVQAPLICHGEWQDEFVAQCEELGQFMGLSLDNDFF
ncbi:MAG: flavodoxin family protein [Pseudomonadota bacterium]